MKNLIDLTFSELEALRQYYKEQKSATTPNSAEQISTNIDVSDKYDKVCAAIELRAKPYFAPKQQRASDMRELLKE